MQVPVIILLAVLVFSFSILIIGTPVEGAADLCKIERRFGDAPFSYMADKQP